MGYKKYSPFLKSIKVLILLSLMYFTTRLDAVNLRIPVTSKEFDYHKLPVYCNPSTKHFKCLNENGTEYCLPDSLKCKIKCANDADLNCEHTATSCRTGEFRCSGTGTKTMCISEHSLCDGYSHCPKADDEHASFCNSRVCGDGQFACRSPGHCLPASKRCDGQYDCKRPGLDDKSDEEGCVQPRRTAATCERGKFRCSDGECISNTFVCDGYKDCTDKSDERNCPVVCGEDELKCDEKCLPKSARCDGRFDCSSGVDEHNCKFEQCRFASEFYCHRSKKCISSVLTCDGVVECDRGEDEVCPASHAVCQRSSYWRCKSGSHCIWNASRCDNERDCPDGSDEADCPTQTTPAPPVCPAGRHLCNGTNHCVLVEEVCAGRDSCPGPDAELDASCRLLRNSNSPCADNNGGCKQLCHPEVAGGALRPRCGCRQGWRVADDNPANCVDDNECERFGICSQLCTNTQGGYSCTCRPGYSRHGNSCRAPGAAKILFTTGSGIEFVDTDTGRREVVRRRLLRPRYVAYDAAKRTVYFHTRDASVGSVGIDGSGLRLLMRNVSLDAVAYDWTRGLLFYSVPRRGDGHGHVGVLNVTNGARARLRTLDCPRGLAVNPQSAQLYVSLWCGARPGVYRMTLDGQQLELVAASSGTPGHLALDLAASPQRLYWTDDNQRAIVSCSLVAGGACASGGLRAHFRLRRSLGVMFDLAVFEDRLYWNDYERGLVRSVSKWNTSDPQQVAKADAVASVTVYHSLLQPQRQLGPCSCQHICVAYDLADGRPATCLCDQRYDMDPSGACVNGTALETGATLVSEVASGDGEAAGGGDDGQRKLGNGRNRSLATSVSSVTGIAIAAVVGCLVVGVAVAVLCLRGQERHSVKLESFAKHEHKMPKVNSRTPLTDCEVDMDKSSTKF